MPRNRKLAVIGVAAPILLLGAVTLVVHVRADSGPYPHPLAADAGDFRGMDYGTGIRGAAAAAPFPILWFGPRALGQSLYDVTLTERLGEFVPSAIVDYDEHGAMQISEGLATSSGQDDAFTTGPSITVHGATFFFYQGFGGAPLSGRSAAVT